MIIPHEFLLSLKEWKGFGPTNIKAVADYLSASDLKTLTPQEYLDIIVDVRDAGLLKRIKKLPSPSFFTGAYASVMRLLEKSEELGIKLVTRFDAQFPKRLLSTTDEEGKPDVPLFLFYKGNLSATSGPTAAIIGTREPTTEGEKAGRFIASKLAENGVTIVSGLALGCDTAGHRGALDIKNGQTVAFLAHGLDTVYPPQNKELAEEIVARGGLLMSEYPIGSNVDRYKLVARDRFQASLSDAIIVIQTGIVGGTMHAVNAAIAAGKPVYAVEYKGHISTNKISGNAMLIHDRGAISLRGNTINSLVSSLCETPTKPLGAAPEGKIIELTLF